MMTTRFGAAYDLRGPDVIVVGAGIVGAACARELAVAGMRVTVLEARRPGCEASAAGMGHIVAMDDSPPQLALTSWSRSLWEELAGELPTAVEFRRCGTIWVAADDAEMATVAARSRTYESCGVATEVLDATALRAAEPALRDGLAGGLRVPGDCVVYPPAAVDWLLSRAVDASADVRSMCGVRSIDAAGVTLEDGSRLEAGAVVNAAGERAMELLPGPIAGVRIRPRKGHLAITDRRPGLVHHQLIELGYAKSAHGDAASSVAFNVQPRATGQLLIGSSRQFDRTGPEVEMPILGAMLKQAIAYLPELARVEITRTWTGFRAATDDKLPLIGPTPGVPGVVLAAGHEGLGITTSLATGRLIADILLERESDIDRSPYRVERRAV